MSPDHGEEKVILVSAVVLRSPGGLVLTVRKRGTSRFMLPGGKHETGETAAQAAARECAEELGVDLDATALQLLGTYRAAAANEDDHLVEAVVFVHDDPIATDTTPAAEIDAVRWLDPHAHPRPQDLAPLMEAVVPALLQHLGRG